MDNNIDIYSYINSPDVAEHCRNIGHIFNALESAVIVAMSGRTLESKWYRNQHIMDTMDDMPIPEYANFAARGSLFEYLREWKTHEENCVRMFCAEESGCVYTANVSVCHDAQNSELFRLYSAFATKDVTIADIWKRCGGSKIDVFTITKHWVNEPDKRISFTFDKWGCYLRFDITHKAFGMEIPDSLNDIHVDIPVPFKRGDIVQRTERGGIIKYYVIKDVITVGDCSSLTVHAYEMLDNCEVSRAFNFRYTDFSYAHGEIPRWCAFLLPLSRWLKDEMSILDLLHEHQDHIGRMLEISEE
jgi:hypothetical protein